jgi:peptide-methionine (R)-S-oxide reductase
MPNPVERIMNRRHFLSRAAGALAAVAAAARAADAPKAGIVKVVRTEAEWRKILTPAQFNILREEGTERPYSSPLNNEKRKGTFVCAGCDLPLFDSKTKYDSGTGWPSFWQALPGAVGTKIDHKIIYPRTEYHCARCDGHQGHVFDDGPKPTGLRYCNNGLALKFIPA